MRRPPDDAADMDRADQFRLQRIRNIVLPHLPRAPAGDIEETVVDRESISVTSGGTALKAFRAGGSRSGSAGSAGISMTFCTSHFPLGRCQSQTEAERSFSEITTPTNP